MHTMILTLQNVFICVSAYVSIRKQLGVGLCKTHFSLSCICVDCLLRWRYLLQFFIIEAKSICT
jgi:hypothetical protein